MYKKDAFSDFEATYQQRKGNPSEIPRLKLFFKAELIDYFLSRHRIDLHETAEAIVNRIEQLILGDLTLQQPPQWTPSHSSMRAAPSVPEPTRKSPCDHLTDAMDLFRKLRIL